MGIIAFIPVRGGSKSIPLKNIREVYKKPLISWSLEALEMVDEIDRIIVATDSLEIESVVNNSNYSKVEIYRREAENAQDHSSTESVMLEYISKDSSLHDDDTFILVQATSPLVKAYDFVSALDMFKSDSYDSIITCVRTMRFFWNENGSPINYNYKKRPRRQDFDGTLMENGAFYINTVKNIIADENRLSGNIGIYEMPEYTAVEIDEADDLIIIENLLKKYSDENKDKNKIKLFVSDVDGVLTDSGMYYSQAGDELKKFNTRDGKGFELLRTQGIKTCILTSEDTEIVAKRATKLQVDFLFQGVKNKLPKLKELCEQLSITLDEVAYIGDDINDSECIKFAGYSCTPADGVLINRQNADIVSSKSGGYGCVREFAEHVLERNNF